jgi:hypothetical protein
MTDNNEAATLDAEEAIQEVETALPTLADIQKARDEKLEALAKGDSPEPEEEEESEAEEVEEEEESEEEVEETESEEAEETPSVLSKDYFDSLSDEDKESVLAELQPSTGAAFGKQRKQIRELKQELEAEKEKSKATAAVAATPDSPFGNIHTEEQVESTIAAIEENVEKYQDDLIYNSVSEYNEKTGEDEKGIMVNGSFVSVNDVRAWAKGQKANIKKLGERKSEIRKTAKLFDDEDTEIETLKQSLNMSEEEASAFESHISDPNFAVIKSVKPEYAKGLFEVLAKAVIADRKPKTRKAPKAKKGSTTLPKGSNTSPKSIVSQIQKLDNIIQGKTKATILERQAADRQKRALIRNRK